VAQRRPAEPGGYHWQDPAHVTWWTERMDAPGQDRARELELLTRLVPALGDAPRLLDLGAGYGAVSAAVLAALPTASAVLVDFSAPMMAEGAARLSAFAGRWRYVTWDLNQPSWPPDAEGPFDAVVSAQALHHLSDERKDALYREVYAHLTPGGAFVIWDPVRPPHPYLAAVYDAAARGEQAPADRSVADRPLNTHEAGVAPLADQLAWLRAAGFGAVDCFWKRGASAIFGGYKTS
jgi:tRNA (cmo5U34)-methyltransferase